MPVLAHLWWLLLWPLPLVAGWWLAKQRPVALRLPTASALQGGTRWRARLRSRLDGLFWLIWSLLVVAMARPQLLWQEEKIKANAVDIVLAIDLSPSMLSRDFYPDRLAVAKSVATDFVSKRRTDRLALVAFSAEAFTQCPLTTDERLVAQYLADLEVGVLDDGTAIGLGLATAVNQLKNSTTASKIVILLTDGENNAGFISPEEAIELTQSLGIRVYTVGIGTEGMVESPVARGPDGTYFFDYRRSDFDTELLERIAADTRGQFFRARSPQDLADIYGIIDRLEKTKIEVSTIRHTTELFGYLVGAAIGLLVLWLGLRWGLLRAVV
jgi:Ca-activated chloride channel homolog